MSRYKTDNHKIVGRKFTMISPVLGEVQMQQLDMGGGKYINTNLSDTISPCTATITIDAANDPADSPSVLTIGEVTLIEGVHWEVVLADVNATALNLATAIGNLRGWEATAVGADVNISFGSGVMNLVFKQIDYTENMVLDPDTGTMTNGSPSIEEPEIT
tara:strand:- start:5082 stop:5561 length:480 start_codon:yes stop_codon:yes gene_type:complete